MRLEVLGRATVEALEKKLGSDGKPLLTKDEVNKEASRIKEEILERAKKQSPIIKPTIVTPNGI